VPAESGAHPVPGQAYATQRAMQLPQAVLESFDARFTDIYGQRGVEIVLTLIRDQRAAQRVIDPRVLAALAEAPMQFGVRADRPGRWQAYYAANHTFLELEWGDGAIFDLGPHGSSGILWFFPAEPDSLVLWLYLYVNGTWVPFDPNVAFPHRVESNGALRCWVPN
jgi:hypothetical protein